ncbi:hypothetical protein INT47_011930 [Mucor saturninus]|uniref:Uncharacterized protein n=1 Tax=Mucor saturninus TaxID=64648 RepID=A0A8H7UWB2_9FUNG|nr:hypothetical protein INT47_011930 [Mucor saturninus]
MTGFISKELRYINPFSSLAKKRYTTDEQPAPTAIETSGGEPTGISSEPIAAIIKPSGDMGEQSAGLGEQSGGIGGATPCGGISSQTSTINSGKPDGGICL